MWSGCYKLIAVNWPGYVLCTKWKRIKFDLFLNSCFKEVCIFEKELTVGRPGIDSRSWCCIHPKEINVGSDRSIAKCLALGVKSTSLLDLTLKTKSHVMVGVIGTITPLAVSTMPRSKFVAHHIQLVTFLYQWKCRTINKQK